MVARPGKRAGLLLELDLTTAPVEVEPDDVLGKLRSRNRPRLRAVLRALHEAGDDDRVRGLVVKVGGGHLPWATMRDLRDGLRAFASSGKPAVAWAETFGDGNGTVDFVLATGCEQVWLQPGGDLGLLGVSAETTFLRGTLDKLGIEPQLDKRYEYKSAADRIMNTEFTEPHREAIDRVLESTWDTAVATIARGRGLDEARVRESVDRAPLTAQTAVDAGLVDRLGYRDEVYESLRNRLGRDVELRFADRWSPRPRPVDLIKRRREVIALVEGRGEIAGGRSGAGPRGPRMGSDTVTAALRAARDDDQVRGVLFRVDSPGGSAVASESIWREVLLTSRAGKPVVVSMGALAGSGGYYVAAPADVIVAQPETITGSIGVLSGKFVITGLLDRVGLTTGAVARGEHARMFSARQGFTDTERERLTEMLDTIYDDFVAKVAAGRSMGIEAVDAIARGRIWSGADAAGNGLVDVLGGQRAAADIAREKAGLPHDAPVRAAVHLSPLDRLRRPMSSDDPRAANARTGASAVLGWDEGGVFGRLARMLELPAAGVLAMPAVRLR